MKYLLDTCVVSELAKKRPSESVLRWIESVEEDDLFVSSVTIGELRKGIEMLADDDARRLSLEAWYNSVVSSFGQRIIQYDKDIAVEWGRIVGSDARGEHSFAIGYADRCNGVQVRHDLGYAQYSGYAGRGSPTPRSFRIVRNTILGRKTP